MKFHWNTLRKSRGQNLGPEVSYYINIVRDYRMLKSHEIWCLSPKRCTLDDITALFGVVFGEWQQISNLVSLMCPIHPTIPWVDLNYTKCIFVHRYFWFLCCVTKLFTATYVVVFFIKCASICWFRTVKV